MWRHQGWEIGEGPFLLSGRQGREQEREESEKLWLFLILSDWCSSGPFCHGAHWGENVHCRTQMPKWRRKRVLPQLHLAFWQAFHTPWLMLPACICSLIVSLVTYELSFTHLDHTLLGTWLNVPLLCLFSRCWEPFQRNQYQKKKKMSAVAVKQKEKRKFFILDHR